MEGYPILFTINPTNPQQVLIKNTSMTFLSSGNTYDLNDPDLSSLITNTQIDKQPENVGLIFTFLYDMKFDITTLGDKRLDSYTSNRALLQAQVGNGLKFTQHEQIFDLYFSSI